MPHPLSREGHLTRLAATKPTQADLEIAARVLRWLSDHAHLRPEEYSTVGDPAAVETSWRLTWAANMCSAHPDDLVVTDAEIAERDAYNTRSGEENDAAR